MVLPPAGAMPPAGHALYTTSRRARLQSHARVAGLDVAVSPIVGAIMVLAISIVGIAGVLSWGLPAIEEMRASVALATAVRQLEAFDAEVEALAAGSAGKTTPKWQAALQGGALEVVGGSNRWSVTVNVGSGHNYTLYGLDDASANSFILHQHGTASVTKLNVSAWKVVGGEEVPLNVSASSGSTAQMDPNAVSLAAGEERELWVWNATGTAVKFDDVLLKIAVKEESGGTSVKARAWMLDVGEVLYTVETGVGEKAVVATNGILFAGTPAELYAVDSPLVPEPRTFKSASGEETRSLFVRLVQLNGTGSFAGDQTVDVLLNLYGTFSLADEADVESVRFVVHGDRRPPWYRFFTDTQSDYRFVKVTDTGAAGTRSLESVIHVEPSTPFQFRMVYSMVTVMPQ